MQIASFWILGASAALATLGCQAVPDGVAPPRGQDSTTPSPDEASTLDELEPTPAPSLVIDTPGCEVADVQAALDRAASGDLVVLGAGECTWSSGVQLDAINRNITLVGAGLGQTVITAATSPALTVSAVRGGTWDLSGLSFVGGTGESVIRVEGSGVDFRLHDLSFESTGDARAFVSTHGPTYGVIYSVTLTGSTPTRLVSVHDDAWSSWQRPYAFGDLDAVFVEDSHITWVSNPEGVPAAEGADGARLVFRYNQVANAPVRSDGVRGPAASAALALEVYDNAFDLTDPETIVRELGCVAGGTGVVYDNVWTFGADVVVDSPGITLSVERASMAPQQDGWQACDGTNLGLCSNIDAEWASLEENGPVACVSDADCPGATTCAWRFCSGLRTALCEQDTDCPMGETCTAFLDGPQAYPCFQQPGYGWEMLSVPLYEWNNVLQSMDDAQASEVGFSSSDPQLIEGRDYYGATSKPGYTAYPYPHWIRQLP